MKPKYFLTVLFALLCASLLPGISFAQTYKEMDVELAAAAQKFWDTNLDPMAKKAFAAFDAGNYGKAIEEANKFLVYAPDTIGNLRTVRGRAHAALYATGGGFRDLINARADLLINLKHKPNDAWNQLYVGEFFLANRQGFEANRHFSKALEIDPNLVQALYGKAQAAFYARDFQGCVSATKSLMAHPQHNKQNDAWSHLRLGQCYASLGDKANARENFERAVSLQPGWKASWVYMAFEKDGYTCKPAGRKNPDKPFERYVQYLRSSNCADDGYSLDVLASIEKDDANLRDDGLFHENEFRRRTRNFTAPDTPTYEHAEWLYKEGVFWLESARKKGQSIDIKTYNELLELFTNARNVADNATDNATTSKSGDDIGVLSRHQRAHLLLQHPDKQVKLLAWREQIALSNVPQERLAGKWLINSGADVRARIIRGRVYSEAKGNHRAAVAEFDAAINLIQANYAKSRSTTDAPIVAEPYWRKGDALAQLGEVDKAAVAYTESLQISSINPDAIAGLQRLRTNPNVIGNSGAEAKAYEFEMMARINEIATKANAAHSQFMSSTGSGRTLKEKCNASYAYYGKLGDLRGSLLSIGSNLKRGTKVWEHYNNTLRSIDDAMKIVNNGLSACS